MRISSISGLSVALLLGCSGSSTTNSTPGSTGGHASIDTTTAQGGSANSSGGSPDATGGVNAGTGGTASKATGGSENNAGGTKATGGTPGANTGGAKSTGGTAGLSTGGSKSTGGTTGGITGGATGVSTGGTKSTGGTTGANAGGTKPTGGATGVSTGGSSSVSSGGTKATTGGTTSAGGQVSFKCANLSFKPTATGKTKPAGAAGGLKVIDWAGFSSAVSYTFDDSNSSQINNYSAMKEAGGHYTFYLQTGKTGDSSNNVWKTALQDGHELGNHTSDHSNCTSASAIDSANSFIKSTFGVTAYAFAAPNGSTGCKTSSVQSKFLTDRSVDGGSKMSPGDVNSLSWLPADIPASSGSDMGPVAGKWRVFCIHGFQGGSDGAYQAIPLSAFTSAVKSAISGGAWVENATNVAAYQWGQNAISKGTGTSATWTLPSVFPPDMCVRVTTSGGTVKQNGAEVPWDEHGYYEISLDAKSVTVE